MSTSIRESSDSVRAVSSAWQAGRKETWWAQRREATWWAQRREATLNWLALGVLLAAWNASENRTSESELVSAPVPVPAPAPRRPEALRGYSSVSVRAATLHSTELHSYPNS